VRVWAKGRRRYERRSRASIFVLGGSWLKERVESLRTVIGRNSQRFVALTA